jgi:hypothetical protein
MRIGVRRDEVTYELGGRIHEDDLASVPFGDHSDAYPFVCRGTDPSEVTENDVQARRATSLAALDGLVFSVFSAIIISDEGHGNEFH